ILLLQKEKEDLKKKFEGIREMTDYPAAMVVVDVKREVNAIKEGKKMNIPVIGIVDTNGNPESVDYPIPANDDGSKAIQTVLSKLADYILEGMKNIGYLPEIKEENEKYNQVEEKEQK
ncbi:MAG: 30S ribosomal protein S2, partial [bacterium]|nr:30S ribosomal protein S2 [bacterium]MDW8163345.1 30S ribosomal protein S2 [Candidatus Omnitrophota bacterium]